MKTILQGLKLFCSRTQKWLLWHQGQTKNTQNVYEKKDHWYNEVKWNLTELRSRAIIMLLSLGLLYLRRHPIPCALDCRAYLSVWREEEAFCVGALSCFPLPSLIHSSFPYSSVWWVPVFLGAWGSWLRCQVLPTISVISILELAANSPLSQGGHIAPGDQNSFVLPR